jgi:hypothetical protein
MLALGDFQQMTAFLRAMQARGCPFQARKTDGRSDCEIFECALSNASPGSAVG